jgi:hypothetical protein
MLDSRRANYGLTFFKSKAKNKKNKQKKCNTAVTV